MKLMIIILILKKVKIFYQKLILIIILIFMKPLSIFSSKKQNISNTSFPTPLGKIKIKMLQKIKQELFMKLIN